MKFSFNPLPRTMRCKRCGRGSDGTSWVSFAHYAPCGVIHQGSTLMVLIGYHQRCLPPNMFHKFAGSLPADHALPMLSLAEIQHSTGTAWNGISGEGK